MSIIQTNVTLVPPSVFNSLVTVSFAIAFVFILFRNPVLCYWHLSFCFQLRNLLLCALILSLSIAIYHYHFLPSIETAALSGGAAWPRQMVHTKSSETIWESKENMFTTTVLTHPRCASAEMQPPGVHLKADCLLFLKWGKESCTRPWRCNGEYFSRRRGWRRRSLEYSLTGWLRSGGRAGGAGTMATAFSPASQVNRESRNALLYRLSFTPASSTPPTASEVPVVSTFDLCHSCHQRDLGGQRTTPVGLSRETPILISNVTFVSLIIQKGIVDEHPNVG